MRSLAGVALLFPLLTTAGLLPGTDLTAQEPIPLRLGHEVRVHWYRGSYARHTRGVFTDLSADSITLTLESGGVLPIPLERIRKLERQAGPIKRQTRRGTRIGALVGGVGLGILVVAMDGDAAGAAKGTAVGALQGGLFGAAVGFSIRRPGWVEIPLERLRVEPKPYERRGLAVHFSIPVRW